jgi:phenylalanyl-tRNA synthetase beta chain
VAFNGNRQVDDVRLYEVAHVFLPEPARDQPVVEPNHLTGVLRGRRSPAGWGAGDAQVDFFDAKSVVESVLAAAGVEAAFENASVPWLHPVSACRVSSRGVTLGHVGELHPRVARHFDLPRGVFAFDLSMDALAAMARLQPAFRGVPRFPAVLRDLAVVVPAELPAARALAALAGASSEGLVEAVSLFDVYQGPQVPEGRKSLAFSVRYRAPDRTLENDEVQRVHDALVAALGALGAELRS